MKTRSSPVGRPRPSTIRCSACRRRCARSTSTTVDGRLIGRRPWRVFGGLKRKLLAVSSKLRSTRTTPVSRSTAVRLTQPERFGCGRDLAAPAFAGAGSGSGWCPSRPAREIPFGGARSASRACPGLGRGRGLSARLADQWRSGRAQQQARQDRSADPAPARASPGRWVLPRGSTGR